MPEAAGALVVALLGAESTGKTTLAAAQAARLAEETGLRCTWVAETLREWSDRERRTPQVHEQAGYSEDDPHSEPPRRGGREELRTYGIGAQILAELGITRMRVLSAPKKMHGITGFGLEVVEYVPCD